MLINKIDGNKFSRFVHGRHLGFQNGRHLKPIFLNILETKAARKFIPGAIPPFLGLTELKNYVTSHLRPPSWISKWPPSKNQFLSISRKLKQLESSFQGLYPHFQG